MKFEPIRKIQCDLCGITVCMITKYDYGWNFKIPKGCVTIDASTFFDEKSREYCKECTIKLRDRK